ncbi:dihydroxyacetone kinase family protein [Microbacterium sp. DT81.1]|uniref:dihydroxyacetone kinase family protein n=1 Tax=Microbacterium sp. DT81.1 TaxID=3393413 RepID=UPI003CFA68CC
MTRIFAEPGSFVDDALAGLVLAHADELQRVDGGVIRRAPLADGRVAVVVGGGSGHYPAFAGYVGPGIAAGAVCGNIFSSPSAAQAFRVASAVHAGGGVLFSYGNYAGDVIHFGKAEQLLRAEGIDTRTVLVTDDIASAPAEEAARRRGIAGDLCVFRIAGAAAERGDTLDEVERLAVAANDRTRTIGVAFAGCTLPGADRPLFTVPEGMMSIGLGIHGEPGIRDVPLQRADELAHTLVGLLLDDRPDMRATRVAVVVNGLGTVKYEELFVLFRFVAAELDAAGLQMVAPLCGELVTSLDMAGASVTLLWLDDELEPLWLAPVQSPALRRGAPAQPSDVPVRGAESAPVVAPSSDPPRNREASAQSRQAAAVVVRLLTVAREAVDANVESLGALDSVAGDGDHGVGMARGLGAALRAARADVEGGGGVGSALESAGAAWSDEAGGTSGALWGAALESMGGVLETSSALDATAIADAVSAARGSIERLGKATLGDKTMLDAIIPFEQALRRQVSAGADLGASVSAAAAAATEAAAATARLRPRLGRARPLAEKSVGHPDPGATSFALIVSTIGEEQSWA